MENESYSEKRDTIPSSLVLEPKKGEDNLPSLKWEEELEDTASYLQRQ